MRFRVQVRLRLKLRVRLTLTPTLTLTLILTLTPTQGRVLHAHRIVLLCSCASDVFRAMLRHPMTETSSAVVEVVGIQYEVMRLLLEYLYLGRAHVPLEPYA